jgi:hypothetical protein
MLVSETTCALSCTRPINVRWCIARAQKISLWYLFEAQVENDPTVECIWSRTGCYTRKQVYEQSCKYANWLLAQDVKPVQWVAVYLQNCPEFMFIWLGLWAIGCAPALINHNLTGDALIHAIRQSGSTLLLVDAELFHRVYEVEDKISSTAAARIVCLDAQTMAAIAGSPAERPGDGYRKGVRGEDNQALIYTRYVMVLLAQGGCDTDGGIQRDVRQTQGRAAHCAPRISTRRAGYAWLTGRYESPVVSMHAAVSWHWGHGRYHLLDVRDSIMYWQEVQRFQVLGRYSGLSVNLLHLRWRDSKILARGAR